MTGAVAMRHIQAIFGFGLATLILCGCGILGSRSDDLGINSVRLRPVPVPLASIAPSPIPAVFEIPQGKGPFPAVIVLHGCAGRGPSQFAWALRLISWGYAALVPDSMTPRGISRVCEPELQPLVTWRDRVGDVGAAVAWLRKQPTIDPNRIAVLGQSHGGSTAALVVQKDYDYLKLRAAIDYYGPCIDPTTAGTVPLLVLAGALDDWGDPAASCKAYGAQLPAGGHFALIIYPGVYHAFENSALTRTESNGHIMDYDAEAAEDSFNRAHAFLDRWVKP